MLLTEEVLNLLLTVNLSVLAPVVHHHSSIVLFPPTGGGT